MPGLFVSLLLACSGAPPSARTPARQLALAGYTTPREVYGLAILPAFADAWKQRTGAEVTFVESYQASGAQAQAVVAGFEADVVALSIGSDVDLLVDAGLVDRDWRSAPNGGIVTYSLAVIAVRPGNPKNIRDWSDLARPGVEVVTPNPETSGGAKWNLMAIWGAAKRAHVDPEPLLTRILGNVRVMDAGARESILTFERGVGDAAITYENEVLLAQREGRPMEYVVPRSTILIENPIAVVDAYASARGNLDLANAFVDFCTSPLAQDAYARFGLRPIAASDTPEGLPRAEDAFTIEELGGWKEIDEELFGPGGTYERAALARNR